MKVINLRSTRAVSLLDRAVTKNNIVLIHKFLEYMHVDHDEILDISSMTNKTYGKIHIIIYSKNQNNYIIAYAKASVLGNVKIRHNHEMDDNYEIDD